MINKETISFFVQLVTIALIIATSLAALYFKIKYDSANAKLQLSQVELSQSELNRDNLDKVIKQLNKEILDISVNYEKRLEDFKESKSKEKIKYIEVKSNECEDIKHSIDSIRGSLP